MCTPRGDAMRALIVTSALLALALLGLHLLTHESGETVGAAPLAKGVPDGGETSQTSLEPAAEDSIVVPPRAEREAIVPVVPDALSEMPCRVFGRVVDEHDEPLAGITVRLAAHKTWASDVHVPRLVGPRDHCGWEMGTDESGSFRFETPVPTAEITWLTITPDPYHDSARVLFGGYDERNRPALRAGDNDLGVFRLATTGAIEGRIVDESGQPIAGVEMDIGPERSQTYGRPGESDEAGWYSIAHAPVGTYMVKAKLEGHLSGHRDGVTVERGSTTAGIDFVLCPSPTLRGRVLDEQGEPVADARLWGWPRSHGSGAGATSGVDGVFTVHLPQDEPYTLGVEHDGYEPFALDSRKTYYEPNTEDIEIVLERATTTLFRVIDAERGEPVERFGLEILRNNGSRAKPHVFTSLGAPPRAADHPRGEVELDARPGIDAFVLHAPGYRPLQGEIEHESDSDHVQILRVDHGASLRGRALLDGAPLARATVKLSRGSLEKFRTTGPVDVSHLSAEERARVTERLSRAQVEPLPERTWRSSGDKWDTSSAEGGTFAFEGLDPGTYRLELRSAGGACCVLVPVPLVPREKKDVGDLVLTPGATILGRVLVPPARSAGGLTVYLDEPRQNVTQTTDASGGFRFTGLSEGEHFLLLDEVPGSTVASEPMSVTLAAGETREVVLDASDCGTCKVSLTIDLGGPSPEGHRLRLVSTSDSSVWGDLGRTDADGRVHGTVRAMGDAHLSVVTRDFITLRDRSKIFALELDAEIDELVRIDTGMLELGLPRSAALPSNCRMSLTLTAQEGTPSAGVQTSFDLKENDEKPSSIRFRRGEGRVLFHVLPVGKFELIIELFDSDAPPVRTPIDARSFREAPAAFYTKQAPVEIRPRETTTLQLD